MERTFSGPTTLSSVVEASSNKHHLFETNNQPFTLKCSIVARYNFSEGIKGLTIPLFPLSEETRKSYTIQSSNGNEQLKKIKICLKEIWTEHLKGCLEYREKGKIFEEMLIVSPDGFHTQVTLSAQYPGELLKTETVFLNLYSQDFV